VLNPQVNGCISDVIGIYSLKIFLKYFKNILLIYIGGSMKVLGQRKLQHGFTLVEISIVLVIIGLLLGGVLKGGEIIDNTKVKNVYNSYRELTAAVTSYQDRYSVIPGDDNAAATRGLPAGPTGLGTGNGNGYIDQGTFACVNGNTANEACQALYQLRLSGFISGADTAAPTHAYGGRIAVSRTDSFIGGYSRPVGVCFEFLNNKTIRNLETKFDDQAFNTGSIRGNGNYAAFPADGVNVGNTCIAS
jgi:prepilin-type N-terminal cleavage/methylation domain-containing protein